MLKIREFSFCLWKLTVENIILNLLPADLLLLFNSVILVTTREHGGSKKHSTAAGR